MRNNVFITGLLAIILTGCNTTKTATKTENEMKTETITKTETMFCQEMIQQSLAEKENVFLSPTSAAMALQILIPGADGTTLSELQAVVPERSEERLAFSDNRGELKVASALWINEGLKVKKAFLKANADAEVYRGPIRVDKVNQWASDKTNGKVTKVLSEPLPPIEMAITNALYFKAEWAEPFHERNTRVESFYGEKGETQVETMHQTAHFDYIENEHMQAVRLYYTAPYCMDIYLPKKGVSLEDGIKDAYSLEFRGEEKKVALALPKVKMEYEKQLNDYLKEMGLQTCFSSSTANFSRLSDTPLYVDFVKQNTYLAIDEDGTEAAAVTTIGLAKMAYRPEPEQIYEMRVNRPFLLLIRETDSNRILFYGIIKNL